MGTRRECLGALGSHFTVAAAGGVAPLFASVAPAYHEARYWHRQGDAVLCELCPHGCVLREGKTGKCRNRQNRGGRLLALGYGSPCAVHVDPIEKKPFYHVLPGARTYSLGVAGCNLRCRNCQNYTISQRSPLETDTMRLPPGRAVEEALREACTVVAFTYTEPSVWIEYVLDTAAAARKAGLRAVMVTSGYINAAPFEEAASVLDAVRIDLKSFSDKVYQDLNAGRLQPVLDTLLRARRRGVWLEVINLVVPQWNDAPDQLRALCRWIADNLGVETPLHFSRFYPLYQLANGYPTPVATLKKAVAVAHEEGLLYVYIGNVAAVGTDTVCPACGKTVIARSGYTVTENNLAGGKCGFCGKTIAGLWR